MVLLPSEPKRPRSRGRGCALPANGHPHLHGAREAEHGGQEHPGMAPLFATHTRMRKCMHSDQWLCIHRGPSFATLAGAAHERPSPCLLDLRFPAIGAGGEGATFPLLAAVPVCRTLLRSRRRRG
jgi:hypothetical protein